MPQAIDDAKATIDARITEIENELSELKTARSALDGTGRSRSSSPRGRRSPTRAKTKRSTSATKAAGAAQRRPRRRTDRGTQFKAIVGKNPVITPSQAAKEMGVSPQQVHGLIKRLSDRGEINRTKKGFTVKA